ncbi:DUF3943 domain-containing protein [Prevotella sp. 10(H)]|uniref:DUF3943 domain-containing protein n=1 Tax=Prevotella sp. 10(H) TaxID=1158294 RepID=UPI00068F29D7|nr:DUF3943 domain-containing protein [Prevotella sp. 10(H)]
MNNNNAIGRRQYNRGYFSLLLLLFVFTLNAQNKPDTIIGEVKHDTVRTISPLTEKSFQIDKAFADNVHKENFKLVPSKINIYDMPYSMTANYPNYKRLALNTGVLGGAGLLTLGVLQLLPEDATSWNKKSITSVPPFRRWARNVRKGPVWDKDNLVFNYVLHPYGGAAFYMGARSQGFNIFYSFLYSAGISTILWEYGIEAFMEIPSIQDLIVTPVAGTILGEGFYLLKRHIVSNDYRLFGSRFVGNFVAYLIDPVNEVIGIFAGNPNRKKSGRSDNSLSCTPWFNTTAYGKTAGFMISLSF